MQVTVGDVSLEVVDKGTGPVVLLVHGFPLEHSMWSQQIDELAGQYRVLAPDLRGFGKSGSAGITPTSTLTMAEMADDLAALLDALGIQEPVVLCGLSMGGYVALQFWRRHVQRLRGLVLCDTRSAADAPEAAANRLKMADKVLSEGSQVAAEAMLPKLFSQAARDAQADVIDATRAVILGTAPATIAAAQRGMAERPEMSEELVNIAVPTLVVCGEHDEISPVAEMRGISASIPGSRFEVILGAGHMAPLEAPEGFNAALLHWLAGL